MNIKKHTKTITDFLDSLQGYRLYIQPHDIPDPDAIASAEAFRFIAKSRDIDAKIIVNGFPHRRENLTFIRECNIKMTPFENIRGRVAKKPAWVFVDTLPENGNITLLPEAPGMKTLSIDHHAASENATDTAGILIGEPEVGATASLLGSVINELNLKPTAMVATALSYAIITDTMDFSRGATRIDLDTYSWLFPIANQKIIAQIRTTSKPRTYFRTIHKSLNNAETYRQLAWAWMSEVEGGEIVAEMADFILSAERITWALALGQSDGRLYLSMRSNKDSARCGRVIKRIVPGTKHTVGGHDSFAGGFIPLDEDEDNVEEIVKHTIGAFLKDVLNLDSDTEQPTGTRLIDKQ